MTRRRTSVSTRTAQGQRAKADGKGNKSYVARYDADRVGTNSKREYKAKDDVSKPSESAKVRKVSKELKKNRRDN